MNPHLNFMMGWTWIVLGFASGMLMGMFFHREDWLGGYNSLRRRMYRLAHISFFGLGTVNLLFYLSVRGLAFTIPLRTASIGFIIGAIAMPICCVLLAHFRKTLPLFAVPVLSLLTAGVLTILT